MSKLSELSEQTKQFNEELKTTPKDKKVIKAFLNGEKADSKALNSVGTKLRSIGFGGKLIASGGGTNNIKVASNLDSRTTQRLVKAVTKMAKSDGLSVTTFEG